MTRGARFSTLLLLLGFIGLFAPAAPARGQQGLAQVSAKLNQNAIRPGEEAIVAVIVDIADGYHAQSHRPLDRNLVAFTVELKGSDAIDVQPPLYAEGHIEEYPALGRMSVYTGRVVTYVPIRAKETASPGLVTLNGVVHLQICDDKQCYLPEELPFEVVTRIVAPDTTVRAMEPELFEEFKERRAKAPATAPAAAQSPTTAPATQPAGAGRAGANWSVPFAFGAAFLAGLLFNIMPCVLPVLPIKAKGFYEVAHHRRGQAFVYGLVFSLGLISVFALLAILVLVLKAFTWGELFSNPYFIWSVVAVLVFLALGMFGGYDVGLPNFIYDLQPRHDTYAGNFFWGALMAVLATPCTAPLLPPLLGWAVLQPATIGVPAVIMVGVGMASPYVILSAFPELARGIPRSGAGAELFKQMLGFMMLAAAVYFAAGRLIPGPDFMWAVVGVVAVAGLYLVARTVQITNKALPVAVSSVLAVALVGGVLVWTNRLNSAHASWEPYSDSAFTNARAAGKPVLVKFTANWCATCQVIEGNVYQDPAVWRALQDRGFVTFKVDLTDSSAPGKDLLKQLNPAGGIPLTAIYAPRADQPIVLESIYTTAALMDVLEQIPPANGA